MQKTRLNETNNEDETDETDTKRRAGTNARNNKDKNNETDTKRGAGGAFQRGSPPN